MSYKSQHRESYKYDVVTELNVVNNRPNSYESISENYNGLAFLDLNANSKNHTFSINGLKLDLILPKVPLNETFISSTNKF